MRKQDSHQEPQLTLFVCCLLASMPESRDRNATVQMTNTNAPISEVWGPGCRINISIASTCSPLIGSSLLEGQLCKIVLVTCPIQGRRRGPRRPMSILVHCHVVSYRNTSFCTRLRRPGRTTLISPYRCGNGLRCHRFHQWKIQPFWHLARAAINDTPQCLNCARVTTPQTRRGADAYTNTT